MYQPYPSSGQPAGPLRPATPAPVRTAVKLMYAGAAVSVVPLVVALAYRGDIQAYHLRWAASLTAAQNSHWRPLIIMVVIVAGLIAPAVWLWMARANGQGRNWGASCPRCCSAWRRCSWPAPSEMGSAVPDRRADLAGRPGRGVAAVAPGLQRVLPAAGRV